MSNFQKDGDIISIKLTRVTWTHGTDHVISLFFNDVFKLEEFDVLVVLCYRLRNCFSSIRHAPTSMPKKYIKHSNNDTPLSSIKKADACKGGKIISLLRLLRLRDPLASTIH